MSGLPKYGDGRRVKVGLLGGSFNPAHYGHIEVAKCALKALGLDQVWLMVSPGNPLKPRDGMASFSARLASARRLADGRRIRVTDIESRLGQRYTYKTVVELQRRFPHVSFVWIMGADGLAQFHRWRDWRRLAERIPVAVVPRPGSFGSALHGPAASVLRHKRKPFRQAKLLSQPDACGWSFLSAPQNDISATALRESGQVCPDPDEE
ncbi:nicotinate-nucleotide adenylyltransferase [Neokomagataea tanensis]|uniref:Probable nicotinate-nucleotide adenylyltransferase n=1 Tax=Neokomagataea tanensis TaxID=661191 RepID=A0A4Y6V833_9PROT|nr:nicotinate-nucleotide adenylyltransferase [Neokomagataea tanensis]